MKDDVQLLGETTELLQHLIRNKCVNDGLPSSGHESRNAATIAEFLDGCGVDPFRFSAIEGRESVVYRLQGTDPNAPKQLWMGHTDVVPVSEERWSVDPFAGELKDGKVYGRGAIDMLNLTSSMAVVFKMLAASGKRPKGDIIYFAVADEESGGGYGAKYGLDHFPDELATDFVVTESGGYRLQGVNGPCLPVTVGEKGFVDARIKVRGVSGHSSMPFGSDNALITAARVVSRLVDYEVDPRIDEVWRRFVKGMSFDAELTERLLNPAKFDEAVKELPDGWTARAHACAHMTIVPTIVHGGAKSNVIPDEVEIVANIRSLPGQDEQAIRAELEAAIGDLLDKVTIKIDVTNYATESPIDTPYFSALCDVTKSLASEATVVPSRTAGSTDAAYFRDRNIPVYGFGLYSPHMTAKEFFRGFHGNDEHIDQESLLLTAKLWLGLAEAL